MTKHKTNKSEKQHFQMSNYKNAAKFTKINKNRQKHHFFTHFFIDFCNAFLIVEIKGTKFTHKKPHDVKVNRFADYDRKLV